jgi:hypothetical protein
LKDQKIKQVIHLGNNFLFYKKLIKQFNFKLFLLYSKIAKLEEELRLCNNTLKTFDNNQEKVFSNDK